LTLFVAWVQRQTPWPTATIQDSVAAIVRQADYQRSIRSTLFERLLEWLGDLFRRIFGSIRAFPDAKWLFLALAIAAVLALSARIWLGGEAEERRRRRRPGTVRGAEDPWIEADRLAATGNFTEAAHHLYRGLAERLAAEGLIRLHLSKTSGDYARELRARGYPAHNEFRQFGRRYDRAMFGTGTCDAETYAVLREHAIGVTSREARAA
jgi:hypothetical protein